MKLAILLGAYNGGRFLREQLDSLFAQTMNDFQLYIRDDGSTDDTMQIVQEYRQRYSNITLVEDGEKNLGAKRNFERLLAFAEADYYMFCDQDDVWLPDKIEVSFAKMKQMEQQYGDIPLLVHTDLEVVDEELNLINPSCWNYAYINPQIVDKNIYFLGLANSVAGCTTLMNRKGRDVSLPFSPHAIMHDYWVALCVMKRGKIDYIPVPTIKYRQHGYNVVGATPYKFSFWDKLNTIKKVYQENKEKYLNAHPLVYKNILQYLFYKVQFSFIIHSKDRRRAL